MYLLEDGLSLFHPLSDPPTATGERRVTPPSTETTPAANGPSPTDLAPDQLMKLWQDLIAPKGQTEGTMQQEFDPYGLGYGTKANKYRDIRDYITTIAQCDENVTIGGLSFKLATSKVPLSKIHMPQYMEAAMNIFRELIVIDKLPPDGVLGYISYMSKIAAFAEDFELTSVLEYDHQYRKLQSEQGFAWGSDSSYLMQKHLRHRFTVQKRSSAKPQQAPFDPASKSPVCLKWNSPVGCNIHPCSYAHVCVKCFSRGHTAQTHINIQPKN